MNLTNIIYEADKKEPEVKIDIIYDNIDELLCNNKFGLVDLLLETVDLNKLSTDALIGILSITSSASNKLPHRAFFFNRVKNLLNSKGEDVDALLRGLG